MIARPTLPFFVQPSGSSATGVRPPAESSFSALLERPRPEGTISGGQIVRAAVQSARGELAPQLREELARSEAMNMTLLNLQIQVQSGRTSLVSNLLKVRHDVARNMIQNVR